VKLKLWSHITNYCLIEVVTKAGMTVSNKSYLWFPTVKVEILLLDECTCSAYTHTSGAGTANKGLNSYHNTSFLQLFKHMTDVD
jgi:hypothetical protein